MHEERFAARNTFRREFGLLLRCVARRSEIAGANSNTVAESPLGLPSSQGARRHELRAFVFADWRQVELRSALRFFGLPPLAPLPGPPPGVADQKSAASCAARTGAQKPLENLIADASKKKSDHASAERLPHPRRVAKSPPPRASQFSDGLIILKRGAEIAAGRPPARPRPRGRPQRTPATPRSPPG